MSYQDRITCKFDFIQHSRHIKMIGMLSFSNITHKRNQTVSLAQLPSTLSPNYKIQPSIITGIIQIYSFRLTLFHHLLSKHFLIKHDIRIPYINQNLPILIHSNKISTKILIKKNTKDHY
jgi:hypothetical protein